MSDYKLKTGKIGETVVDVYKKVESAFVDTFLEKDERGGDDAGLHLKTGKVGQAVVDGYKKVEEGVVGGYKKIEDAFVSTFLEKVDSADDLSEDKTPEEGTH